MSDFDKQCSELIALIEKKFSNSVSVYEFAGILAVSILVAIIGLELIFWVTQ